MWSSLRLIFPLTGKSGGQSLPTGWARPAPDGDPIGIAAAIGAAVPDPASPGDGSANADDEAGDGSNEGAGVSINATARGEDGVASRGGRPSSRIGLIAATDTGADREDHHKYQHQHTAEPELTPSNRCSISGPQADLG